MIRVDRLGSLSLVSLLVLFQLVVLLPFNGLKGVNSVGVNYADSLAPNQPLDSLEEAKEVWRISDKYIYRLIGYDSLTGNLVALGESTNGFFFFSQSSQGPLWARAKAAKDSYIWEQAVELVPYTNGQTAILTNLVNQYRLLDLSRGEPLTQFFQADYAACRLYPHRSNSWFPVSVYVDEDTEELRILATYDGTARLLDEQLTVLWNTVLLEHEKQSTSSIINVNISQYRQLALIYTRGNEFHRITCLDLADGTILWHNDTLFPAGELQSGDPVVSDFDGDGILDVLCVFSKNDTQGLALLDGLNGLVLWQVESNLHYQYIWSFVDLNQDGTKDLIIVEKNRSLPSESVVTALSISPELTFWQKHINETYTGDSWIYYSFYADEFCSSKAGLEVLICQWNHTTVGFEDYESIEERRITLRLVTGDSFTLLWNITGAAGPARLENLPNLYYKPQPDLNGDGRADFIFDDGESGVHVHDGESAAAYSRIPRPECRLLGSLSRDPDDLPALILAPKDLGADYYFYSFAGIRVPKDKPEGSHGIGNSIPFLWELIACTLFVGLFKYGRIQRRSR